MNKFEQIVDSVVYFSRLLGHFQDVALEVNKISKETRQDFLDSKRTGQCAIAVHKERFRVSGQYVHTDDEDLKIRYSVAANNKINFLLENPERMNTFPVGKDEEDIFKIRKIFGGGISLSTFPNISLIAVSGFHPKIDEASSIVAVEQISGIRSDSSKILFVQKCAKIFSNPYALAISCGAGFIKGMSFDQAVEWGKNEINS